MVGLKDKIAMLKIIQAGLFDVYLDWKLQTKF